jgi:hypothetical protein
MKKVMLSISRFGSMMSQIPIRARKMAKINLEVHLL